MSLEYEGFSLKQISAGLDCVEKWLNDKGIAVTNNRFAEIKENMLMINTFYGQGRLDELPPVWGNEKIIASIVEATSFVNIYKAFKDFKDHRIPRKSLKKAVEGPYLSQDENGKTNEARNFLFELELAAIFTLKGLEVLDFNDVSFKLDDAICNIQCKRPMSGKSLNGHIKKAVQQGQNFFDREKSGLVPRGIIAISIDKMLGTDKQVIRTLTAHTLENHVNNKLKEFVEQHNDKWSMIKDHRFLAVFVFMRAVVEVKNPLTFGPIRHIGIDHFLSGSIDQVKDTQRLQLLAKLLAKQEKG